MIEEIYHKPDYIKNLCKNFRKDQTVAEKILRKELKCKKLYGFKFHRQKSIFVYTEQQKTHKFFIADFYHHPSRLVIEIDGLIHNEINVIESDELRTFLLKQAKYKIIRFSNDEIYNNLNKVLQNITEKINKILESR